MNVLAKMLTLNSVPLHEVPAAMSRLVVPAAYKEVGGSRSSLTDIKPAFLWPVLTRLFGPIGFGWWYEIGEIITNESLDKYDKPQWTSTVTLKLYYKYTDGENVFTSEAVTGVGGSPAMSKIDYAQRGAVTNAVSDAAKMLHWQLFVYQGWIDHNNVKQKYADQKAKDMDKKKNGVRIPGTPLDGVEDSEENIEE